MKMEMRDGASMITVRSLKREGIFNLLDKGTKI
jgi:hypothetical protein